MTKQSKRGGQQVNVRFTQDDLRHLHRCQQLMGGVSQSDAIRLLMLMYLGKTPAFPNRFKRKKIKQ